MPTEDSTQEFLHRDKLVGLLRSLHQLVADLDAVALTIPQRVAAGLNPSTDLDAILSESLVTRLQALLPVDVLSEEAPFEALTSGYIWVVDPLDGTLNAIVGCPNVSISIALVNKATHAAVLGMISLPYLNLKYSALAGGGVFLNQQPFSRPENEHRRDLIAIGVPGEAPRLSGLFGRWITNLIENGWTCRQSGSAALDLVWAAIGYWRGFWEAGISIWDIAAGDLIAREAGLTTACRPTRLEGVDRPYALDYLAAEPAIFGRLAPLVGFD